VISGSKAILAFWFEARVRPLWFRATAAFDQEIRDRFLPVFEAAAGGRLVAWARTPEGTLALVIVLDQFPLNMFRGSARAYATGEQALRVAEAAIGHGFDAGLAPEQKHFLYLPFMHSESREDQRRAVALFAAAGLEDALRWARHHQAIIERFGRFPHRNALLGRESTPEELAFLQQPGTRF